MIRINISFILLFIAFVACSKKESSNEGVDSSLTDECVMTVPLKLSSSSFAIESETDDEIVIDPCTPYYKEWMSSDRMTLKDDQGFCDMLDYPILDVYITNNTNQTINIKSLDIRITESSVDKIPYVYISNNFLNQFIIKNESWFDWGNIIIDYHIMKRNESFDGTYDRRKIIPYFEDEYIVDFTQDLIDMGLDMTFVNELYNDSWPNTDYELSPHELLELLYPFEVEGDLGFARIYGEISFTKSGLTKSFYGEICFYPLLGGAEDDFDDIFDVELDYDRRDYIVRFPYSTTLKPGDNESVRLTLKCPRSSNHKFYISINNDNGLTMRTKDVMMHYLNGRHSTKQPMYTEMHAD